MYRTRCKLDSWTRIFSPGFTNVTCSCALLAVLVGRTINANKLEVGVGTNLIQHSGQLSAILAIAE